MITVQDLLKSAPGSPVVITPTDTVYRVLQLMVENNAGSVAVTHGGCLVGIFTKGDFFQNVARMGRPSLNIPIGEIMTKNMITVRPDQTLEECLELMTRYQIDHLPVKEGEELVGNVSKHDVMERIISAKQDLIERLENYILGAGYGQ